MCLFSWYISVTLSCRRESLASFHDMKHAVSSLYVDEATGRVCTAGKDRVLKVWDAGVLLAPAPRPPNPSTSEN